jgi:hypothetical protein
MTDMRAKFYIVSVETFTSGEKIKFAAVGKSTAYSADGSDEDNTYAKFSPSAACEITVANPALLGKFKPGEKFYVNFEKADK